MEAKEKKKPNQKEHYQLTEVAASWKAVPHPMITVGKINSIDLALEPL
jgi:hypothetical protein